MSYELFSWQLSPQSSVLSTIRRFGLLAARTLRLGRRGLGGGRFGHRSGFLSARTLRLGRRGLGNGRFGERSGRGLGGLFAARPAALRGRAFVDRRVLRRDDGGRRDDRL